MWGESPCNVYPTQTLLMINIIIALVMLKLMADASTFLAGVYIATRERAYRSACYRVGRTLAWAMPVGKPSTKGSKRG